MKITFKELSIVILLLTQTLAANENKHGYLFIIGGGNRSAELMERFFELAGGYESKVIIIPMASSVPLEVAQEQKEEFKKLGCKKY